MAFFDFLRKLVPWHRSLTSQPVTAPAGQGRPPAQPPPAPPAPPPSGGNLYNEDWLLSSTWLHLASSNVEAIRYLWDAHTLEVEFKGENKHTGEGYLYQYFSVPPEVADAFTKAGSPGRFVWNSLRDRYPYVRLHGFAATAPRTPTVVRVPTPKELQTKWGGGQSLASALTPPWQQKW